MHGNGIIMIQSFQCPVCGTLNALGEPECSECGQAFVYNCPVCGSPLNNRYPTCPNCRTVFNWGGPSRVAIAEPGPAAPQRAPEQQAFPAAESRSKPGEGLSRYTARPIFWVTLIVICAILIALLLIIDGVINK
jgi:hypothetical protein